MPAYVYLLRCADNSLYTGITNDLAQRLKKHNQGSASKYTRSRLPVDIVYTEEHTDLRSAARREYQIKGWTKQKKERLILGIHPNPNK